MKNKFKPLLAAPLKPEDLSNLRYPVYVSPKLDGIRALVIDGVLVSRTLKPIPNKELQARYGKQEFNGLDGELIYGSPTAPDVFNKTTSCVMARDANADQITFWVFDAVSFTVPFEGRRTHGVTYQCSKHPDILKVVPQIHCLNEAYLKDIEQQYVEAGYEGVMLRDPNGRYKFGRSTLKEQILLKFKRFETSEAKILGMEELFHNDNEATTDERGYTKRSSHKENQRPTGTLGALVVQDLITKVIFSIGTGFTAEERQKIWDNHRHYVGKIVSYQHFPIGVIDKPRFPSYRGLRDKIDL